MTHMDHAPTDALDEHKARAHGGHSLMTVACCIPTLLIAGFLVATGVVSAGFLVYAFVCLGMMGAMMWMMGRDGMKM